MCVFPSALQPSLPAVLAPAPPETRCTYTQADASRVTGLSRRQLEWLAERGVVRPALRRQGGRRAYLSFEQLMVLTVLARLGLDPSSPAARRLAGELQEDGPRFLYCDGRLAWRSDRDPAEELCGPAVLMACDVHAVSWRVREQLDRLGLPYPERR